MGEDAHKRKVKIARWARDAFESYLQGGEAPWTEVMEDPVSDRALTQELEKFGQILLTLRNLGVSREDLLEQVGVLIQKYKGEESVDEKLDVIREILSRVMKYDVLLNDRFATFPGFLRGFNILLKVAMKAREIQLLEDVPDPDTFLRPWEKFQGLD